MERLGGQLRAMVNGGVGALTPITDYTQVTVKPATTDVTLTPLQPGQLPTVYDPVTTGYANPVFAASVQRYTQAKMDALNAQRAAIEKAQRDELNANAAQNNYKAAAIGASAVLLAIKFLL